MKRILFTLLALAGFTASQAQDFEVDSVQYQINTAKTNEVNVWGYTCKSGVVDVPSTVVNPSDKVTYTVTAVAGLIMPPEEKWWEDPTPNGFYAKTDLKSIKLPSTVRTIGYGAFSHSSLINIVMPEDMDSIKGESFVWCTELKDVKMPKTLKFLGDEVFTNCTGLTSMTVPSGIQWTAYKPFGVFTRCSYLKDVTLPDDMTELPKAFFQYCSMSLETVTLPKNLKSIGFQAFDGCLSLKSIELPSGITEIGNMAFQDCPSLTEFTCDESLKTINYLAFNQCYKLAKVNIPASVDNINSRAFDRCMSLTDINVAPGNATYVFDKGVLMSKDKKTLVIRPYSEEKIYTVPEGIETLGESSIYNQPGRAFVMPASLKDIQTNALWGDTIVSVHFQTATPPAFETGVIDPIVKGAVACVPKGSAAAYKAVEALKNFRIQEEDGVPFIYTAVTPENDKYLKSVDSLTVAFDEAATLVNVTPAIQVEEDGNTMNTESYGSWKAELKDNGKLLLLAFVDKNGNAAKVPFIASKKYSLVIPEGIAKNAAGLGNGSITISENGPDLLVVTSATPVDGSSLKELSNIDIYFDNTVNWVSSHENHDFKMYVDGVETALPAGLHIDTNIDYKDSKHVTYEIDDKNWTASPITLNAGSTYKFVISANILSKKSHSATLNDEITLTYKGTAPTGIQNINVDKNGCDAVYTIGGVKVKGSKDTLRPGIYIMNGKKMIVK